ncbi:hypothetical protein AABB24_024574 [Solanum stoloniferum]|uniref:Uncharacterized protein n=1 Tax=Solanum stoloniferum TaxID=62892 RepID=A0ABD2SPA8_9SOLN
MRKLADQQDYAMVCANTKTDSRSHIGLLTLMQQWLLLLLYFVELIIPISIDFSINPNSFSNLAKAIKQRNYDGECPFSINFSNSHSSNSYYPFKSRIANYESWSLSLFVNKELYDGLFIVEKVTDVPNIQDDVS